MRIRFWRRRPPKEVDWSQIPAYVSYLRIVNAQGFGSRRINQKLPAAKVLEIYFRVLLTGGIEIAQDLIYRIKDEDLIVYTDSVHYLCRKASDYLPAGCELVAAYSRGEHRIYSRFSPGYPATQGAVTRLEMALGTRGVFV